MSGAPSSSSSSAMGDMWVDRLPSPPPTPAPPEASLTTQERLRLAKRRRAAQMKRWTQRDAKGPNAPGSNGAPDIIQDHMGGGAGTSPDLAHVGVYSSSSKKKMRMNAAAAAAAASPSSSTAQRTILIRFVPNVMLLEAAARNDVEEVRRLLEMGVSPDSTNEDGLTALHQCCIDDSEEMMQLLISYGGDPNATDTEKWTPLHAAATCGHLHLVKFLIDSGADLLAVNADGNMPYDLCEDETTLSYIENEMAKRGVTQDLIDNTRAQTERQMLFDLQNSPSDYLEYRFDGQTGATPLHVAAANGYLSVVEYLLDNHVSTEVVDDDMWQPIHAAACWGHLEVVEMLAQNGANISAKTKNGETPFDICEDPEIKERLIQLKEQRVRHEQPRVRRSRSTSTRTQSIRRTSLREKMNTTKKDVQDEKLYFIQSFDAMPKNEPKSLGVPSGFDGHGSNGNDGIVDINDVELTLAPTYFGSEREVVGPPPPMSGADSADDMRNKPRRPPRSPSKDLVRGSPSSPSSNPNSEPSTVDPSDKINIHVSVTINAPPGSSPPGAAGAASSPSGTTLADLKKARSMSRNHMVTPQDHAFPDKHESSSPSSRNRGRAPMPPPPQQQSVSPPPTQHHPELSPHLSPQMIPTAAAQAHNFQRFSDVSEVVGPTPKKKGCCAIL